MMRVIFLGAPGTGKGTQAGYISKKFGVPQISTGNILRKAVKDGTDLGVKAKAIMEAGGLVSDDIMIKLVEQRLSLPDCDNGYILDGFPRTLKQAQSLDEMLKNGNQIDAVIYFDVEEEELVKRITSRRVCVQCGKTYNVITDPPPASNLCEIDGGEIIQRDDDKEETVRKRLKVYQESTSPLYEYYKVRNKLFLIDASRTIRKVREAIIDLYNR
jgi:adenylate kinase